MAGRLCLQSFFFFFFFLSWRGVLALALAETGSGGRTSVDEDAVTVLVEESRTRRLAVGLDCHAASGLARRLAPAPP